MGFQNAQAVYKQNMKQAEKYKKTTDKNKAQGALKSSVSISSTTSGAEASPSQQAGGATQTKQNAYQQNALQTASRGDLTLLLYNGCIKFIDKARKALEEKNIEHKNKFIIRAQDIIRELMVTLKTDTEVGQSMFRLYDFIHRRLVDANVNNDTQALEEARELVVEFRDTWKETIKLDRQQRFGEGGQA